MKKNATAATVQLTGNREVLISYGVPVAAFIPGRGYIKTSRRYSTTTSRHANQYADHNGSAATVLDDATFRALVPEIVGEDRR